MNGATTPQGSNAHAPEGSRNASPEEAAASLASAKANSEAVASTLQVAPNSDNVAEALARMQTSRARLRRALIPKTDAPDNGHASSSGGAGFKIPDIAKLAWRTVRDQLRRSPSLREAVQTLHEWWKRQPWQDAATLAGSELRSVMAPVVRRHPWASVGAAAALGAAVMLARPWRWSIVNNQWQTLRAEAMGAIRAQLFHVPLQMLLASLASLLVVQATSSDEPPDDVPPANPGGAETTPSSAAAL